LRVVSVNVGLPREVVWKGRTVTTGIFKQPVEGRIAVRAMNLDGDGQADLSVHGGASKALYGYPAEHYDFWRRELPEMELTWGMFGENLSTEGLFEDEVAIGDRFRIGTTELTVTGPRMPCYKLGLRFGRDDIIKRFLASGRTGFYFAVALEGEIGAGDPIERIGRGRTDLKVSDITRLYVAEDADLAPSDGPQRQPTARAKCPPEPERTSMTVRPSGPGLHGTSGRAGADFPSDGPQRQRSVRPSGRGLHGTSGRAGADFPSDGEVSDRAPADFEVLRRAAQAEDLPEGWRSHFQRRLEKLGG